MNKSLLPSIPDSVFVAVLGVQFFFFFFRFMCLFSLKVSQHVKLELQNSEYFQVAGPKEAGSKVGPGMSATFIVSFSPQENKVLVTEWSLTAP